MAERFFLREVDGKKQEREFLNFPARLYKKDKNWIRPLDDEVKKVFDPKRNKLFRTGEAIRWLLLDEKGKTVGRMAAFYDKKTARRNEQPTGGVGFFDCINNQQAANTLFDAGKNWLRSKGMEAMDGPVNFGDRDNFWGCLKEGFYENTYNMPYNFPYYNDLFENYGFKNYFNQYVYYKKIQDGASEVSHKKAERIFRNPDYRFDIFRKERFEQYASDFLTIYNKAWARFPGVSPMRMPQAKAILYALKPVIYPPAFLFGYYKDEPIAFYIMIPDINQIIRHFNGKLHLLNKIRLYLGLNVFHKSNRLIGLIFGVAPEHQGKGVEAAIIKRFEDESFKPGFPYVHLEMNWIGDFNPAMMKMVEQHVQGQIYKTYVTYRYLFDRTKEFKRAPRLR
jgi:GNAT superfamily N-acetyltransferase